MTATQEAIESDPAEDEEPADEVEPKGKALHALQERYEDAQRRLIVLFEAELQKMRSGKQLGRRKDTVSESDRQVRKGRFWPLAKSAVDFGGEGVLSDLRELIRTWRAKPWLPRRHHFAVRCSPGAESSGDEHARYGQRGTPRRRVMGVLCPNVMMSREEASSMVVLHDIPSVHRFNDTCGTIVNDEALDKLRYAIQTSYLLNLSRHFDKAVVDLRLTYPDHPCGTTPEKALAQAKAELIDNAPIPQDDTAGRQRWLKNKLQASRRFAHLAGELGTGVFVFLKPAELCERQVNASRLTNTIFACWIELIRETNQWIRNEQLRRGLDVLLEKFLRGEHPTEDQRKLAIEGPNEVAMLAAQLRDDPPSIFGNEGFIVLEEAPEHRRKRVRGNAEKDLDSGLGGMYTTPERVDGLLAQTHEDLDVRFDTPNLLYTAPFFGGWAYDDVIQQEASFSMDDSSSFEGALGTIDLGSSGTHQ